MLITASLTGGIVGALLSTDTQPGREQESRMAATRAGFVTALVSAAVLVIRTTVLHAQPGEVTAPAFVTLAHALVSLLPATFMAMFTGGLCGAGRIALLGSQDTARRAFSWRPIHALYAGCVLAGLAPFVPGFISPPTPVTQELVTPKPAATPQPAPTPVLPAFSYTKPAGWISAEGARLIVADEKSISNVESGAPMQVSPDGKWLAFVAESGSVHRIVVWDLDGAKEWERMDVPGMVTAIAWSPNSERLAAILNAESGRFIAVLVPAKAAVISLPRPEQGEVPHGSLSWPVAEEVVVYPNERPPLALNLDRLEYRSLENADFYASLDAAKKEKIGRPPVPLSGQNTKFRFDLSWAITAAGLRFDDGTPSFRSNAAVQICATDLRNGTRAHLSGVSVQPEDRVLYAPDASKVIVVRGSTATVYYLGLRDLPLLIRRVEMHRTLDAFPKQEKFRKLLEAGRLYAFVYAPLINPLNNKTVGARSSEVKGVLRVLSWEGTTATVLTQEFFASIEPTDVVARLHTWEKREFEDLIDPKGPEWWTLIGNQSAPDSATLVKSGPSLEVGPALPARPDPGGYRVPAAVWNHRGTSGSGQPVLETRSVAPSPSAASSQLMSTEIVDSLGRFITGHHARSSAGNIDLLMFNYADYVDHFRSGVVPKDAIRAEEVKYRSNTARIVERVEGRIQFREVAPSRVEARYPLRSLRVKLDGSWAMSVADVTLEIEITETGPKIVKQNAVSREGEKRRGDINPPNF